MGTVTPSSPADAALRRADAFLRAAKTAAADSEDTVVDERQMLLPHVDVDVDATDAAAAPSGAAVGAVDRAARGAAEALIEKTIWGSPAGKKKLAPRLVKLIPPHKTYVEPFAGSGAVFFAKEPAAKEVLSDADPDIATAYKALSTLTDSELAALKKKDWTGRKTLYRAMQEAKPKTKIDKLYRFLYLSHFAYGKLRGKSFNPNAEGTAAKTIDRIEKYRDRLRNVIVRSGHYADVVKEFDGKNTFFFLDPPYPGYNVSVGENKFDEKEFRKILDGIQGKFLITYGVRGKLDTSGFEVRTIRTPRTIRTMRGVGGSKMLSQLLIANYKFAQKSLGPYELGEVETTLELPLGAAADLDLLRVLAKALANDAGVRVLDALVDELVRIEDAAGDRTAVIAAEVLPVGDRLVLAIDKALPELATAIRAARPTLQELAKAEWSGAYINDLPDSAFLYVERGGDKDDEGKTVPRSLRHFPVRDANGKLDVAHLQNAIARIPQSTAEGLSSDAKAKLQDRARRLLEEAQRTVGKVDALPNADSEPVRDAGGGTLTALAKRIPLLKTGEERYVLGIVLEPETVDAQGDIYSAETVRDAAHKFMAEYQHIGFMHKGLIDGRVKILESYLAPTSFELDGSQVKKGTWLLAVRVLDDDLWAQIKNGELTGLSMGGSAVSAPEGRGNVQTTA